MDTDTDWNALSPVEKADSLTKQAKRAQKDGQDQLACSCYIQSLNLYRGLDDRPNTLKILIRLGYLSGWADFGDGLDMFTRRRSLGKEALPLAREIGDNSLLAQALVAFAAGETPGVALPMLEESAVLAEECGDKSALAWAKTRLAGIFSLGGDSRRTAMSLHKEALALYEEIEDKKGIANVLFAMSIRAPVRQKRKQLERALVLRRELGEKKRTAEVLMRLQSYCNEGELDLMESYNLEALDLCREINIPIWAAGCLNRLAEIARKRGDNARAEELKAESLRVYQPPPPDPEFEKAFREALDSKEMKKFEAALKRAEKQ